MSYILGILTESNTIIDDIKSSTDNLQIKKFKSIDSISDKNISILLITFDFFKNDDLIQFYLSRLRKKLHGIPVILILRVSDQEKFDSDWFTDDFILYPLRKGELDTRIRNLIEKKNLNADIIQIGKLQIDIKEYAAFLDNERVELTYKEFELLRLLILNRGKVFSRNDLLQKIWGIEYIGGTRTVDVHIRRLRGKLGDEFNTIIETVRNVGYRCREE